MKSSHSIKYDGRSGHKFGQHLPIYNPRYSLPRQSQEMRPRHGQLLPSLQSCIRFKQVSSNTSFDYVFVGGHWPNYALMHSIRNKILFHFWLDKWPMTANIVMGGAKVKSSHDTKMGWRQGGLSFATWMTIGLRTCDARKYPIHEQHESQILTLIKMTCETMPRRPTANE
jgi:hypothetical protein